MGKQKIASGRYTMEADNSIVVFIIGMRVNRLFSFSKWIPVARAMGPMIQELYQHREYGFLSHETFFNGRGVTMIQYWRSFKDLERYAKAGKHLKAWRRFNKLSRNSNAVGIFHESYIVQNGHYECIYGNMPTFGLGKIGKLVPAEGRRKTAGRRLKGPENQDAEPVS